MRGRYPSEVRLILRPWKASGALRRERAKEREGEIREKNHSSYIDTNLGYYGISFSRRKKKLRLEVNKKGGSTGPNTCDSGLGSITASYLVQCQASGA